MISKTTMAALLAAATFFLVNSAEAKRTDVVTSFCGDRYCPSVEQHVQRVASRKSVRRHRAPTLATKTLRGYEARMEYDPPRESSSEPTPSGMVTVETAASINITVSRDFEPKIVAFIAANVAAGKRFKKIHCLNFARTHVRNSLHFSGNACDFDPHPIAALAKQYGLRTGCSFLVGRSGNRHPDCMHVDNAYALAGEARRVRVAKR